MLILLILLLILLIIIILLLILILIFLCILYCRYEKAAIILGEDILKEIKESSTINDYIHYKKERNERKMSQQFLTLVQDPYSITSGSLDDNYIENNITTIGN